LIHFVPGLVEYGGYDAVWVVVDWLSKMRHDVLCQTTIDARGQAELFLMEMMRLHGLLRTIVSDRGPQFAAVFWMRLCEWLGIDQWLSTGFYPQTNGQIEWMIACIEQYLWILTSHQQDDWV
jgi:transposase InsO family protein